MKTKLLLVTLCLLGFLYLQFGRAPYVNLATTQNASDGYVLHLTVTANKLFIVDEESYAKSLIQRTLDNKYKNMIFPYEELGYPKEIRIKVYANSFTRFQDIPAFEVHYTTSLDGIKIILKEHSFGDDLLSPLSSYLLYLYI